MGRDISNVEEQTNGEPEVTRTQIITENQLILMKLDAIINLLTAPVEQDEPKVE